MTTSVIIFGTKIILATPGEGLLNPTQSPPAQRRERAVDSHLGTQEVSAGLAVAGSATASRCARSPLVRSAGRLGARETIDRISRGPGHSLDIRVCIHFAGRL